MNQRQFSKLYHTHYKPLCLFALRYLTDTATAEDIVQDTFANLWNKKELLKDVKSIKSYFFTAVRNNCLTYNRDTKTTCSLSDPLMEELPVTEDEIERAEMEARIWKMIDELPERRREIFLLAKRDGLSYAEIAVKTGLAVKTVENHVFLAMQDLRKKDLKTLLWKEGKILRYHLPKLAR